MEPSKEGTVLKGGFQLGDELVFDWLPNPRLGLVGGRLEVFRTTSQGRVRLKWLPGGVLRDASRLCVYVPYLGTESDVTEFASLLASMAGYSVGKARCADRSYRFTLEACKAESLRVIAGDCIAFNNEKRQVHVVRSQGTVDMNLYSALKHEGGRLPTFSVGYISMAHHPHAIARVIAEANGLLVKPALSPDTFLVVPS